VEELKSDSETDGGETGMRKTRRTRDPLLPTKDELHEHEKTHLPIQGLVPSLCPGPRQGDGQEADAGRGRDARDPHRLLLPDDGKGVTILAARERKTRMTMATVVPRKGTMGSFAAQRLTSFMMELGLGASDVIIKGDQEPAIKALIEDVTRLRAGARTIPEHSPVGSSGSNGVIERAIWSIEAQIRVMKSALENHVKTKIDDEHPIITWLAEYAAWLLNRFEVGRDGKTAYERMKGKSAKVQGTEFGEKLLWKRRPVKGSLEKLTCLWDDGVFLGVRGVSGEILIGTKSGIMKTRTIQRRPVEERWGDGIFGNGCESALEAKRRRPRCRWCGAADILREAG
jgi:hypothetical protein